MTFENVEQWRPVPCPEYAEYYSVSDHGRVKTLVNTRRKKAGDFITLSPNSDGYLYVAFFVDGTQRNFLVHRLVAMAFIGECPEGMEIDHVDRDKNNNHVSNLEYVTHFENIQRMGGKENIPAETITTIRSLYKSGMMRRDIAIKVNLSLPTIFRIVTNKRYYDPNYTYVKERRRTATTTTESANS